MRIPFIKLDSIGTRVDNLPSLASMRKVLSIAEVSWVEEQRAAEVLRDNPILDRIIEVGTKALRRGLMSGETLRAPRQQLRRLRASAFDLLPKSPAIARLSGARRVFGFCFQASGEPAIQRSLSQLLSIQKNVRVIRKNSALVTRYWNAESKRCTPTVLCFLRERPVA
jgi:ADP-heptose:LPS heptosyltransferase